MSPLYKSLCGRDAIDAAMDIFYADVLTDDHMDRLLDPAGDDQSQRGEQRIFLTFAFGAPRQVRQCEHPRLVDHSVGAR